MIEIGNAPCSWGVEFRYAAEIEQYEAFFNRFEPVRIFNDGGYEVKIYHIPDQVGR